MPHSITLSKISWSAPDGNTLLTNLDLTFGAERTGLVGRNGVGKTTLLRLVTGELAPQSGTVTVDGAIGLLRQTVQVAARETVADLFGIADMLDLLARAERGMAEADELADADWTVEARFSAALARVGLQVEPKTPLSALSGGQPSRRWCSVSRISCCSTSRRTISIAKAGRR